MDEIFIFRVLDIRFLRSCFLIHSSTLYNSLEMTLQSRSASGLAGAFFCVYMVYLTGVAVHRLYFSKYSKFPGPKLAALTYGYMFYYDAIAGKGQYIYKIKDLHEEYSKYQPQHCNTRRFILIPIYKSRKSNNPHQSTRAPHHRPRFLRRPLRKRTC